MSKIKLSEISTAAPADLDKKIIKKEHRKLGERMGELQYTLYAQEKYSLLVVIQGMDASGKDGAIRDVFTHVNPQGINVKGWKAPSKEELSHDFLWRIHKYAPAKGMIQCFNRSHYEDVLITRVHKWCDDATAVKRFAAINDFEKLLTEHNSTHILKFYLHVDHKQQMERLKERTIIPKKMWKHNDQDMEESKKWDEYMKAYEDAINNCNAIPWHIVPSDSNWYKEYYISKIIVEKLESLNMSLPTIS